jgi:hypothetical protein
MQQEMAQLHRHLRLFEDQIRALRATWTWKIGRSVTKPLGALRRLRPGRRAA